MIVVTTLGLLIVCGAVLWLLWKMGLAVFDLIAVPFPTEGMKSAKQSRVAKERREFKAMQDARAKEKA